MTNVLSGDGSSSTRQGVSADYVLELIFVGLIATGGLGLAATLLGIFEAPQIWLLGILITAYYFIRTKNGPLRQKMDMRWAHVGLLLVVALFFRLPAFHFVLGGQDEGVYVNMANYIERTGGIAVSDDIANKLADGPALQKYLASNRESDGTYLAGIYSSYDNSPGLQFQFYHLFPVWMALVSGIFGISSGVYALTLFAVLSILFAYRLVLTLTGQPRAALVAGLLLALNPLHVFFSKFPVTEVPTLALSLSGFSYLAGYWLAGPGDRRKRMLVWAFAAFATLFFVRISGFMYVPFFVALACLAALRDNDQKRRSAIQLFVAGVILVYAVSVMYGLSLSSRYANDIYNQAFAGVFGDAWTYYVTLICVFALLLWIGCLWLIRFPNWRQRLGEMLLGPIRYSLGLIVIAGVALAILKIYWLGWTHHYAGDPWLNARWGLADSGWRAAKASSFAQLGVYMGPLLLFGGLVLLCFKRRDPALEFLRLFAAGFVIYALVLQWVVPYGPYYARYLLSEALPYLTLFIVCAWAATNAGYIRRLFGAVLALSLLYAGVLSAGQLGKQENDGLYAALDELVSHVDASDVILLDSLDAGPPNNSEIKTPLIYTFGKNVVTVSDADVADPVYLAAVGEQFDDTYLISPTSQPPPGFENENSVRVNVWGFRWAHGPPLKLDMLETMRLHLFRLTRKQVPMGATMSFRSGSMLSGWLAAGWSTPEPWGIWAAGSEATLAIDTSQLPANTNGLNLRFQLQALVSPKHRKQRAEVDVNGKPAASVEADFPVAKATMDIPLSTEQLRASSKIRIRFVFHDAVSPQSLGPRSGSPHAFICAAQLAGDPAVIAGSCIASYNH